MNCVAWSSLMKSHRTVFMRSWRRLGLSIRLAAIFAVTVIASVSSASRDAFADEDGISFWIPGFFGSLAAAPQQPGWALGSIYYHTSVSGGGNCALARGE